MKKGNVVELRAYRRPRRSAEREGGEREGGGVSKELQLAIKRLIQRMRKHGPMRRVKRV